MAAFRTELNRREPEDEVAHLLSSMRQELVEARASLSELKQARERAAGELARERALLEQTERRGRMAEGIGDAETARVAAEFAAKHRERVGVLEQKAAALDAEWTLRSREADEMKRRFQEADANRAALVAQLRNAASRQRIRSVGDDVAHDFDEFDRMADRVAGTGDYADALRDLEDPAAPPPPAAESPESVEARLRELKRQMGRE